MTRIKKVGSCVEAQDEHWIVVELDRTFFCEIDRNDSRCQFRHVGIRRDTDRNDELAYSVVQLGQRRISDDIADDGMDGIAVAVVVVALIEFAICFQ